MLALARTLGAGGTRRSTAVATALDHASMGATAGPARVIRTSLSLLRAPRAMASVIGGRRGWASTAPKRAPVPPLVDDFSEYLLHSESSELPRPLEARRADVDAAWNALAKSESKPDGMQAAEQAWLADFAVHCQAPAQSSSLGAPLLLRRAIDCRFQREPTVRRAILLAARYGHAVAARSIYLDACGALEMPAAQECAELATLACRAAGAPEAVESVCRAHVAVSHPFPAPLLADAAWACGILPSARAASFAGRIARHARAAGVVATTDAPGAALPEPVVAALARAAAGPCSGSSSGGRGQPAAVLRDLVGAAVAAGTAPRLSCAIPAADACRATGRHALALELLGTGGRAGARLDPAALRAIVSAAATVGRSNTALAWLRRGAQEGVVAVLEHSAVAFEGGVGAGRLVSGGPLEPALTQVVSTLAHHGRHAEAAAFAREAGTVLPSESMGAPGLTVALASACRAGRFRDACALAWERLAPGRQHAAPASPACVRNALHAAAEEGDGALARAAMGLLEAPPLVGTLPTSSGAARDLFLAPSPLRAPAFDAGATWRDYACAARAHLRGGDASGCADALLDASRAAGFVAPELVRGAIEEAAVSGQPRLARELDALLSHALEGGKQRAHVVAVGEPDVGLTEARLLACALANDGNGAAVALQHHLDQRGRLSPAIAALTAIACDRAGDHATADAVRAAAGCAEVQPRGDAPATAANAAAAAAEALARDTSARVRGVAAHRRAAYGGLGAALGHAVRQAGALLAEDLSFNPATTTIRTVQRASEDRLATTVAAVTRALHGGRTSAAAEAAVEAGNQLAGHVALWADASLGHTAAASVSAPPRDASRASGSGNGDGGPTEGLPAWLTPGSAALPLPHELEHAARSRPVLTLRAIEAQRGAVEALLAQKAATEAAAEHSDDRVPPPPARTVARLRALVAALRRPWLASESVDGSCEGRGPHAHAPPGYVDPPRTSLLRRIPPLRSLLSRARALTDGAHGDGSEEGEDAEEDGSVSGARGPSLSPVTPERAAQLLARLALLPGPQPQEAPARATGVDRAAWALAIEGAVAEGAFTEAFSLAEVAACAVSRGAIVSGPGGGECGALPTAMLAPVLVGCVSRGGTGGGRHPRHSAPLEGRDLGLTEVVWGRVCAATRGRRERDGPWHRAPSSAPRLSPPRPLLDGPALAASLAVAARVGDALSPAGRRLMAGRAPDASLVLDLLAGVQGAHPQLPGGLPSLPVEEAVCTAAQALPPAANANLLAAAGSRGLRVHGAGLGRALAHMRARCTHAGGATEEGGREPRAEAKWAVASARAATAAAEAGTPLPSASLERVVAALERAGRGPRASRAEFLDAWRGLVRVCFPAAHLSPQHGCPAIESHTACAVAFAAAGYFARQSAWRDALATAAAAASTGPRGAVARKAAPGAMRKAREAASQGDVAAWRDAVVSAEHGSSVPGPSPAWEEVAQAVAEAAEARGQRDVATLARDLAQLCARAP